MKKLYAGGAVVLALLLWVGFCSLAPRNTPTGQPGLVFLSPENFSTWQEQFNANADKIRVLLLLSPT